MATRQIIPTIVVAFLLLLFWIEQGEGNHRGHAIRRNATNRTNFHQRFPPRARFNASSPKSGSTVGGLQGHYAPLMNWAQNARATLRNQTGRPNSHTSRTSKAPVVHTSTTSKAPVVHTSTTSKAPVVRTSTTSKAPDVHTSTTSKAPVVHTSRTSKVPVVNRTRSG